ncbi:MAG: VTC domain-containing protein [Candidatus Hydrogenedentota bacterium]
MPTDKVQRQRFELKYVLQDDIAAKIRDFLQAYLTLDEYGATQPDLSYPVHSLYLDSDDLRLYRSTINGDKNRYKMRLRFYERGETAPVYFEIKRRSDCAISKLRGKVLRKSVDTLLAGQMPVMEDLAEPTPAGLAAVQEFFRRLNDLNASPKAHVAYRREAWVTDHDNSLRITFDREVRSEPQHNSELSSRITEPVYAFGNNVIFEIKFTDRVPRWVQEMVRAFGLRQQSAGKYVDGIASAPLDRLNTWHATYI